VEKTREIEFAADRNTEINASVAAVAAQRELVALAEAWNRESAASLAAVESVRMTEFTEARNNEIAASLAAVEGQRELVAFAQARNVEITASLAAVEGVRMTEFAAARNAEIKTSMMAYELQRTSTLAMTRRRGEVLGIETGSVETKPAVVARAILPAGAQTPGGQACQSMLRDLGPIYWVRSTAGIDGDSRKRLDELAAIANRCASMVIEIHGHSDSSGSPAANKRLSQRRAQIVADYLVGAGVEAGRVVAVGHGAEAPIVAGDQPESMACNRRIEFTVRDTSTGPNLSQILESLR
jgi:outer membrane protein OmpA-like peptidoglycan-associated protein